jgi:hypothetical protein
MKKSGRELVELAKQAFDARPHKIAFTLVSFDLSGHIVRFSGLRVELLPQLGNLVLGGDAGASFRFEQIYGAQNALFERGKIVGADRGFRSLKR